MKGVIVAAGYGSRFLPISRTIPKEMLPVVDRPALDYVVEELVEAGVDELLIITSRRKKSLDDWFDRDPELEAVTRASPEKAARIAPPAARVFFVRQREMRGTGHALLLARPFVGNEPFVVAYPDDLYGRPNCTAQLLQVHERTGASVLAAVQLAPEEDVSRYGVLDVDEGYRVRRFVEKPPADEAPSRLISVGRFVFSAELFSELEAGLAAHQGGEFYHVGAINALAARGQVVAEIVKAHRYDTGTPLAYLQTVMDFALAREDIAPSLRPWLADRLTRD